SKGRGRPSCLPRIVLTRNHQGRRTGLPLPYVIAIEESRHESVLSSKGKCVSCHESVRPGLSISLRPSGRPSGRTTDLSKTVVRRIVAPASAELLIGFLLASPGAAA